MTLPDKSEDYIHRVGRVGRADRIGLAISIVAPRKEKVGSGFVFCWELASHNSQNEFLCRFGSTSAKFAELAATTLEWLMKGVVLFGLMSLPVWRK